MKHFNFLSNLLSLSKGSQSSDVSLDCRLTVGSPSVKCGSTLMRLVAISAFLLTIGVGNAWGADGDVAYTLQMSDYYSGTKPSGYAATQDLVFGTVSNNKTWNVPGNVTLGNYFAIGGTGLSNTDRVITGKSTITNIIKEVRVNYSGVTNGKSSSLTLNSAKLEVSSNSSFTQIVETVNKTLLNISSSSGSGSISFTPSSDNWASGKYYRITFTCTTTGSRNSHFDVTSIVFIEGAVAASNPTITTSVSSLTEVGYSTADFSQQVKSFTVSGSSLTANVTVTAPTNYEVCKTSGGTYTSSVTFDKGSGTLATSTVYVRLQSGKTAGNYSGNVACSSSGATTKNVAVSGSVPFTVTWKANGTTHATTYVTYATGAGTALGSLPDDPDAGDYCGDVFYGWYDGASYSHASVAPSIIGTSTKITSDKTYVAVFADEEDGGTTTVYKLVSSLTNAKDYVFVTRNTAGSGYALSSSVTTGTSVTITTSGDDKIVSGTPANTIIWAAATGWNLQNKNTSTYLVINGSSFGLNASAGTLYWSTDYGLYGKSGSGKTSYYVQCSTGTFSKSESGSTTNRVWAYEKTTVSVKTHTNFKTTCCTSLGTINGSVNLTTSSTGTSVTVSVNTDGVNAYGDANNVSGYDFKLYTASAGGSAAATYSSDSKAGTSHTFTGLTPLTQYWVTVRPIGSGSYCNTTAESDRVAIYTCPGSPNHVDVSGRWDRFGGETISLTAAAYATAGTGTAIPAAKITGYQWQKYYNSIWNDISNGGTISGATTNNLQITNCSNENSGSYRCVVSTVAGCDIASDGFQVKVYALECYNSGTTVYNFTRTGDTQAGTVQIDLSASTNYGYKVHADNDYYGNSGTVNEDVTNWEMSTGVSNNLTVASGLGGTFTFAIDYSTGGNNSTEGIPEISVTYPRKTIYLTPGVWNSGEAKFAFYYFRKVGETIYGEGFTDFITADDCGSSAEIPLWNGVKINAVRLNSNTTASDLTNSANHYKAAWNKKWNQTSDITITSNNSISITGWGTTDSPYEYGTYAVPTYTISYATGSVPTGGGSISGSKANETKTCGVDFDLPAAQFTTTGYVQTGWSKADGGAQYAAVSGSYTDNSAQTFYPVWTANTHTLTWDKNGGDALTGDYTSGTVAYATAITAPNTPTWTGHTFGGWHNGTSIVTPATAMPDNDLTYTAQWSLATYTVTLNTNGGTINAGDVDEYTYGTGATLPTNVTRDGYRFDGWFTDDGVWSDQVTAISTTATGDKTYYAKWTQVYTVTWSVNGETWSSGVVEGNTHVPGGSKVSALPTAPTSSECDDAKVFMGWRASEIDGTSVSDPGGIFTTQAGSPTIDANKTFYAVFADSNEETKYLTNSEIQTFHTADATTHNSYAKGPFTLTSSDGNWYGVFISQNDGGVYTANVKEAVVTLESTSEEVRPYIMSPTYSDNINSISILATHGSNTSRTLYVCSAATATPASNNIGSIIVTKNNSTPQEIIPSSTATTLYLYAAGGAIMIKNIDVNIGSPSNYVTSCSSCDADATFTNTTPAVSAIGCTSATLTATSGLATLGADGCHVSDYGFVIGTSDNPAIGGSGVTKLQVGTSDPTIGEDFSYDATGLTKGTHYYIRAYAINRHGTAYSSSQNFWTKDVSSIAITTAPTKTNYIVGETFDATGMVVTATMASGSTEAVTGDVTYSESALTAGASQNFPVNYTLCETEKSVNQVINVYTLSVTEGTNDSYGTATNSSANIVSITGLGDHKTYTVTVTSSNATAVDNGDNTWSIINPTGNVTVRVDYADAVQVKVYYKVDGVTVTGLTQDVYQSETTTLPTASELATAMTAQSMDLPDDDYPNFVGWSETEFPAQTSEPTLVTGTPTINAEKTYYAVYTNLSQVQIEYSITSGYAAEANKTIDGQTITYGYLYPGNNSGTRFVQFQKDASNYGRIYNSTSMANLIKLEAGYYNSESAIPVYACSAAGTITGSAISAESHEGSDPYVYTFPSNTSYFMVKGDNSTVYKPKWLKIYYCSSTVYYMTQFCTRYTITGARTSGTAVTGGTLTSSANSTCEGKSMTLSAAVNAGYAFEGWTITGASSGDMTSTLLGANASSVTPPAFTMPAENITVSATITEKEVTGWTWKQELADASEITIPATVELYIGQQAKFNLKTYDPADVLAGKKGYSADYTGADLAQDSKAGAYYITRAKIAKESTTLTLTSTSNGSVQEVITIRIKELPLVHFVDNIHGETFADVVANVDASEKRTVYTTKPTPTHSAVDDPGGSYNTCERQHLHLIGWIESEWADAHPNAKPGDITGAGAGNYYAAGANIDLVAQNGKTFYAVWAKFE